MIEDALQRIFPARNEILDDETQVGRVAVRFILNASYPAHRPQECLSVVGPDHAAASREPSCLDYDRPLQSRKQFVRIGVARQMPKIGAQ
jgi:hypothetical protein